jgi:glycine dehydrogenase subunit 2
MLIEPTESESRASLNLFIMASRDLAMRSKRGETERFSGASYHAPRRRLDEALAAVNPILHMLPPQPVPQAAE